MKKTIAVLLALILMMTVVFFGCGKKEEEKETDNEETSQQANEGETTTQSGDIVLTPPAADVAGTTAATTPDVTAPSATPSTVPSTSPSADVTAPSITPSQPATTPSQPSATLSYLAGSNLEKYSNIFKSGTYRMTVTTVSEGVDDIPIDFACKNGNVRMGMSMEGIPAIMIYRADNDTAYLLIELMGKLYTELTEEMMGEEIDFSEATDGFEIPENGVLTVTTETFNGKTVTAETVTADGKASTFYFDNSGNLVGTMSTEDGDSAVSKISNFSTSVDDSLFEIPDGYVYMDMSWLM